MKRIAIIGYGNIARKHIEVFRALGCEIVASSNRSESGNQKAREEENIPETFTDYMEMIRVSKPDALIVCVSFWNMYEVLKNIIPLGIPVLAEKPTGTSLQEHMELTELAERHNCKVMVGLNRRHYSVINRAIEDAGGRDKITSLLIEWSEDPIRLLTTKNYTEEQTGKLILSNSIHGLDTLAYIAGNLKEEKIFSVKHEGTFRWIMNLSGISKNDVLVNFNSNWDNFIPFRIVMTASEKRYIFAPVEACVVFDGKSKEARVIEPSEEDKKFKPGFYEQARLFLSGDIEAHNLKNATESMRLADKLYSELAAKKQNVQVPGTL